MVTVVTHTSSHSKNNKNSLLTSPAHDGSGSSGLALSQDGVVTLRRALAEGGLTAVALDGVDVERSAC